MKRSLITALAILTAFVSTAADREVKMKLDKPDGIYKTGETARLSVSFLEKGKIAEGQKIVCTFFDDTGKKLNTVSVVQGNNPATIDIPMKKAGSVMITAKPELPDGVKCRDGKIGVIASPETLRQGAAEPADFDKFWKEQKELLAKVPMKELERKELPVKVKKYQNKFKLWDIKVSCVNNVPVSGWLTMPSGAAAKSLPAIVCFQGAGVYTVQPKYVPGAIVLDVNAHGILNGQPREYYQDLAKNQLKDYRNQFAYDKQKIYFHDMFLRVIRALEYAKSLPEWDGKNLIVRGCSQGGGQTLVAAAMEPQVTLALASVPALCDHGGCLAGRKSGWPYFYKAKDGKPLNPKIAEAVRYYDCVNFAKQIRCEIYFTTGLVDQVCVPASVFSAYNNVPDGVGKHITTWPEQGHNAVSSPAFEKRLKEILPAEK